MGTEDLEYSINGVRIFGNATFTVTYPEHKDEQTGQTIPAQDYVFTQARSPHYEKEPYNSFETDESLVGEWTATDRMLSYYAYTLSYIETIKFCDNGIMIIHYISDDLALDRYMYYAYTAKDGELTFSPVIDKNTKYSVSYVFDDDGNLNFSGDNTSTSIFADEIFSDAVFYAQENLPDEYREGDTDK